MTLKSYRDTNTDYISLNTHIKRTGGFKWIVDYAGDRWQVWVIADWRLEVRECKGSWELQCLGTEDEIQRKTDEIVTIREYTKIHE